MISITFVALLRRMVPIGADENETIPVQLVDGRKNNNKHARALSGAVWNNSSPPPFARWTDRNPSASSV
jgi:hypothetical protein